MKPKTKPKQTPMQMELQKIRLVCRIDSYLEDTNLEDNERALGIFSASELGSSTGKSLCQKYPMGCARLLYYRYAGVEPQERIQPRIRRIFDTGHHIHDQLQTYLERIAASSSHFQFSREASFNRDNSLVADLYELSTTADGIVVLRNENPEIVFILEIKTINHDDFIKLGCPKPEHVVQAHVYMAVSDIKYALILYYDKDKSNLKEYVLAFDEDIWSAIKTKIDYVREHRFNGSLPPPEQGFHCRTCKYEYVCKPDMSRKAMPSISPTNRANSFLRPSLRK